MLLALFAAIGIGSIVAAWIARLTVISGLRQASTNALRDDFAEWLKQQEVARFNNEARLIHLANHDLNEAVKSHKLVTEASHTGLLLYYRMLLRLDYENSDNRHLLLKLSSVAKNASLGLPADTDAVSEAVAAGVTVFAREWEVTKWGFLAGTMTRAKAHWRFLFH